MRKIKTSVTLLILLCAFQRCHQTDTSSFAKAAISASCSSTINFSVSGDKVFADVVYNTPGNGLINVGGEGSDELGINFYSSNISGAFSAATYDLATNNLTGAVHVDLYWDPGNDGVDEYSSISGTLIVNSVNYVSGIVQSVDITFNNVTVKNAAGATLCVNAGHIYFKLL